MIFLDPTETQALDTLQPLDPHPLPHLEDRTGADMVLSLYPAPAHTGALCWKHVEKGAGYQLKRGADIVASVRDGRLMQQLVKMLEWWPSPWLVHVADVGTGQKGYGLYINGRDAGVGNYDIRAYISTVRSWQRAGGKWVTIPTGYDFLAWVKDELRRMERDEGERLVSRSRQDVKLYPLTEQEETLASLPGIGPTRAHALWESMKYPSLTAAITMLLSGDAECVSGIGKGIVAKTREFFGLAEGDVLMCERRGE